MWAWFPLSVVLTLAVAGGSKLALDIEEASSILESSSSGFLLSCARWRVEGRDHGELKQPTVPCDGYSLGQEGVSRVCCAGSKCPVLEENPCGGLLIE
ncbi:hypothetical protein Droror1_Dr00028224, partial [Drosera rotundifolia]